MKKRFPGILLALALLFGMAAAMGLMAFAEENGGAAGFDLRDGNGVTETRPALNEGDTNDKGYTFGGWYTGKDGTGDKLTGEPEPGTTYYARWFNKGKTVLTQHVWYLDDGVLLNDEEEIYTDPEVMAMYGLTLVEKEQTEDWYPVLIMDNITVDVPLNESLVAMEIGGCNTFNLRLVGDNLIRLSGTAEAEDYCEVQALLISGSVSYMNIMSEEGGTLSVDVSEAAISNEDTGVCYSAIWGYYAEVTVEENVTLNATAGNHSMPSAGTYSAHGIRLIAMKNNGTVNASSGDVDNAFHAVTGAIWLDDGLTNNGTLTAVSGSASWAEKSSEAYGLRVDNPVVNNGIINAGCGTASDFAYSVWVVHFDNRLNVTENGSLTANGTIRALNLSVAGAISCSSGIEVQRQLYFGANGTITLTGEAGDEVWYETLELEGGSARKIRIAGGYDGGSGTFTKSRDEEDMVIGPVIAYIPAPEETPAPKAEEDTEYIVCPACGRHSWSPYLEGWRCDNCGHLRGTTGVVERRSPRTGVESPAPQTGDNSAPALEIILLSVTVLTGAEVLRRKRSR